MFRHLIREYSKSFIAGARTSAGASSTPVAMKSPLTIYHNPASPISSQLLAKLSNASSTNQLADPAKFSFNLKTNQLLTFADYEFIVNECADIHPHNTHVVRRLLNTPKHAPLCVSDFHKLSHTEFPVIIDYDHKLVANDEASFDRIMQHYLLCGIQHLTNLTAVNSARSRPLSQAHIHQHSLVHPHVAEFADLF
ncbi:uncharacterized protein CANTADRAFT_41131 [Suhomyces tanzawaensis NRRL Y-17324]